MSGTVEFWFDFSSPYGYFASHRVDSIAEAAGRNTVWRPFMIGGLFRLTGSQPMISIPLKGAYAVHDWERLGRFHGVPWVLPDPFPVATLAAARTYYWLAEQDVLVARQFAKACYDAYFSQGLNIEPVEAVADIAAGLGVATEQATAAAKAPEWKAALKSAGEEAVSKGVCGSPFFIVDGEGFWGGDRLDMIAEWLRRGATR